MMRLRDKLGQAHKSTASISVGDALLRHSSGDVLFVDVRDASELEREGTIPGAIHVSRGLLEFAIDPISPSHNEELSPGMKKQIIVFCASGPRSILAAQTMAEMGLTRVRHLEGGFNAWRNAGGAISARPKSLRD